MSTCQVCGTLAEALPAGQKMMVCGRCKSAFYCSAACQKGDWRTHKQTCAAATATPAAQASGPSDSTSGLTPEVNSGGLQRVESPEPTEVVAHFGTSREDRIRGAYFGALVSDALCLGSHYEYDAQVIKKAYGGKPLDTYMAPGEHMGGMTHGVGWGRQQYHPGQKKGDNTDYGLYNELIMEYLSGRKNPTSEEVDLNDFVPNFWAPRIGAHSWGAWRCTQTRQAFEAIQSGRSDYHRLGGNSNAMSLRSAPIFAVATSEDAAAKASQKTMFTHLSKEALLGGEFFTRAAFKIIHDGLTPSDAFEKVDKQMNNRFIREQVRKGIAKYEEAVDPARPLGTEEFVDDLAMTSMARLWDVGKTEPIKVGKASPTEGTMPSSIYIILKYIDDPIAAFKANAMVGGDNAARAVAVGMIMGAYHGASSIPQDFQDGLHAWKRGEKMFAKFGLDAASVTKDKP